MKHPYQHALAGALRDRRDADMPVWRGRRSWADYGRGGLLRSNETALFTGPVLKRQDRMVTRTRLKALVLTDQPRSSTATPTARTPERDVASLAADGADLSVVVEGGQGRVRSRRSSATPRRLGRATRRRARPGRRSLCGGRRSRRRRPSQPTVAADSSASPVAVLPACRARRFGVIAFGARAVYDVLAEIFVQPGAL